MDPNRQAQRESERRPPGGSGVVERLFVYWLISTAGLALLSIVTIVFVAGALQRQSHMLRLLADRVTALEAPPAQPPPAPPSAPAEREAARRGPVAQPAPPPAVAEVPRQAAEPVAEAEAPAAAPPRLDEPRALAQLGSLVRPPGRSTADVSDAAALGTLLDAARGQPASAEWSTAARLRLAVAARLIGRDSDGEYYARTLAPGGEERRLYDEVVARVTFERGRVREALPLLERVTVGDGAAPDLLVLRAAAQLELGDGAAAESTIERVSQPARLAPRDRLRLARLGLALERADVLAAVLPLLSDVPAELEAERDFLRSAGLVLDGRSVEGLAALDFLVAHESDWARTVRAAAGPPQRPSRYELEVWRGVALVAGNQLSDAREILLTAAQVEPSRADAYLALGRLEAAAGQFERAAAYLRNAIAAAPRSAGALEALAAVDLNLGNVGSALESATQAIALRPRSASVRFLRALAHAKLGQREAVELDLRAAFQLDRGYLDEARRADVIGRLFTPEELEALAGSPASAATAPGNPR